jgi:hypothetical protein
MTSFLKNTLIHPSKTLMGKVKVVLFFSHFNFSAMNYLFKPPLWMAILMMALYGFGCQKQSTERGIATVSGRVVTYGTKTPVPDATIYVLGYKGELFGPQIYFITDSVKTDANGKYTFKTNEGRFLKIVKKDYFKMNIDDYAVIDVSPIETRNTTVAQPDIVIDPVGWLKIRVKNVKPEADNDNIGFSNYSCAPNEIYGKLVDAVTICPQRGNRKNNIIYFVNKHGISVFHQDSIYIKGLDTTYYSINY